MKVRFADKTGVMLGHNDDLGVDGDYDQDMEGDNKLVFFKMNVDDCQYIMKIEISDQEGNTVGAWEVARETDKVEVEEEEEGMD